MRARYVEALQKARVAAFHPEEYVGQENFLSTAAILALARQAHIGPTTRVLDLCCGVGGPGNLIARERGSRHLGIDRDPHALELARRGAHAEYRLAELPETGLTETFDVVLLLETMLAFRDKAPILAEVAGRLRPGGFFVMTLEEGQPLSAEERAAMPESHTVWPVPLAEMEQLLEQAGLHLEWSQDQTESHGRLAARLEAAFRADSAAILAALGPDALAVLLDSHRLWAEWLASGRIRKFALLSVKGREGDDQDQTK